MISVLYGIVNYQKNMLIAKKYDATSYF